MNNIKKETNDYTIYYPKSLSYITDNIPDVLNASLIPYKKLFKIDNFRKVQINFFDNIEDFRKFIYSIREENTSLPSYAKATFDNGMINAYIEPDLEINSKKYNKRLFFASHELFHIMYKELIIDKENIPRITWFDEGMAQLFSGEFSSELSNSEIKNFVKNLELNTRVMPNLNNLSHGVQFETEDYSGYKLSLIAVKYLYDTLPIDKFRKLMKSVSLIEKYSKNVIIDAIKFYKK